MIFAVVIQAILSDLMNLFQSPIYIVIICNKVMFIFAQNFADNAYVCVF